MNVWCVCVCVLCRWVGGCGIDCLFPPCVCQVQMHFTSGWNYSKATSPAAWREGWRSERVCVCGGGNRGSVAASPPFGLSRGNWFQEPVGFDSVCFGVHAGAERSELIGQVVKHFCFPNGKDRKTMRWPLLLRLPCASGVFGRRRYSRPFAF